MSGSDETTTTLSDEYLEFLEDAVCSETGGPVGEIREVAGALGASVPAVPPPPAALRDRLMASVAEANRFAHLADGVAELYGISKGAAEELLGRVDDEGAWKPGPMPGLQFLMVEAGEAYADHVTTLVKIEAGSVFPWHEHVGEERTLVLQGQCREPDGTVYRQGEWIEYAAGTAHDFTTPADGPDFVFATRVGPGFVTFGGKPG